MGWISLGSIFLVAATIAVASLIFRDSIKGLYRYFLAKRKSRNDWLDQSIDHLQRIVQEGTNLQASSGISEEKLQEIEDQSKELLPHARGAPRSLDRELKEELVQVGYMVGWGTNLVRDLKETDSISEIMEINFEFKRRMDVEDIDFAEMVEDIPEDDIEKWDQQAVHIFNQVDLDLEEYLTLGLEMIETLDGDIPDPEDIPWEVIDESLDEESLKSVTEGVLNSFITVLFIELPEESMRDVEAVR